MVPITEALESEAVAVTIRRQRQAMHLSLAETARLANVSTGFLSMLENGALHQPGYDRFRRVAVALGLDPRLVEASPLREPPVDLAAQLGACLAVARKAGLAELSRVTSAQVAEVRRGLRQLSSALSVCGMRVIDSGYEAELAPLAKLGLTAAGMAKPNRVGMTEARMTVLAIVAAHGIATRRLVEEIRTQDSADILTGLVQDGYLEAHLDERAAGRPLTFRLSPRVLEEVGMDTIEEMRALIGRSAHREE